MPKLQAIRIKANDTYSDNIIILSIRGQTACAHKQDVPSLSLTWASAVYAACLFMHIPLFNSLH